jgi:hypothetical protein
VRNTDWRVDDPQSLKTLLGGPAFSVALQKGWPPEVRNYSWPTVLAKSRSGYRKLTHYPVFHAFLARSVLPEAGSSELPGRIVPMALSRKPQSLLIRVWFIHSPQVPDGNP